MEPLTWRRKTGYGLSTSEELRLLSLSDALNGHEGVSLDPTWLGAHDRPPEHYDIRDYVDEIRSEQLPQVLEQGIARSADVFCEPGWFDLEQTEDILRDAKQGGMDLRLHLDEFKQVGGAHLRAAELGVTTADHVHHTTSPDRAVLAESGVMQGFLPGTPFSMGTAYPRGTRFKRTANHGLRRRISIRIAGSSAYLSSVPSSFNGQESTLYAALVAVSRNPATTTPHLMMRFMDESELGPSVHSTFLMLRHGLDGAYRRDQARSLMEHSADDRLNHCDDSMDLRME